MRLFMPPPSRILICPLCIGRSQYTGQAPAIFVFYHRQPTFRSLFYFLKLLNHMGFGGLAKIEVTTANIEKTKNVDKEVS